MAVPKRKVSKSRRDKRRVADRLKINPVAVCGNCGQDKLPHHLCLLCKTYNNINFITVKKLDKESY